jgi:hypothetical protein
VGHKTIFDTALFYGNNWNDARHAPVLPVKLIVESSFTEAVLVSIAKALG